MVRNVVLALTLVLPLGAIAAFVPFTRHIDGATITARHSATQACGVDLDIALTDHDQRMVVIDYTYSGTFDSGTFSGPYTGSTNPTSLRKDKRSDVINASMGNMTYLGQSHITYADPRGLFCLDDWSFNITAATTYNASQVKRDEESELKRKEREKIDEINRRKAEQAEHERWRQQQLVDQKKTQLQAKYDALTNYRRSTPGSSGCILNDLEDIARCNRSIARIREDRLREETSAVEASKRLEAERIAAAKQAAQFKEADALYERTRADPCALAAEQARRMPQLQEQARQNNWSPRQLADAQAQWKQSKTGLDAMCASTKNQIQSASPQTQTAQPQDQLSPSQQKVQVLLELVKQLVRGK